ncbi:uncharacterized protein LOC129569644 [Sitodiplosis mosellana]|uniref:uncharacterized protein LOC129569644 n=1 Tax=Sitodiplosis mosellana TaxID=263140 RepID=UPI002443BD56|nr:uncharacterized protein LOC129569644 [Sitodiplosis mosellana]
MIKRTSRLDGIWQSNELWKPFALLLLLASSCSRTFFTEASRQGNIGCLYVNELCLQGIEYCFDDDVIGKCINGDENDIHLAQKEYLDPSAQTEFSDVFRDVHSIVNRHSLPWDHEYVQCRLQNSLFAISQKLPYSSAICWEKIPERITNVNADAFEAALEEAEQIAEQQAKDALDEDASIQYSPRDNNFADEIYYPPMKRRPDLVELDVEEQRAPYDHRNHYETQEEEKELKTRMDDLKNRIELRRMLSEYMSGSLKPPIFYKDGIAAPDDVAQNDDVDVIESLFEDPQPQAKRIVLPSQNNDIYPLSEDYDNFPLTSLFREHQRENIEDLAELGELEEFDPRNNDPNEYHHRKILETNRPKEQSAVYTEGGLVYGPSTHGSSSQHRKHNQGFKSLLEEMSSSGFTRHERLDVKKPGPPVDIPIEGHPAINSSAQVSHEKDANKDGPLPKIKKVLHLDGDDDHAPHSVDTQFAHVILKTPMDTWHDGSRVISAIADLLNMKDLLTSIRVDRHEIAFRVENNPNKTALDVARAINDGRFKNNLSRRLGVTVLRAGVGNKTKELGSDVSSTYLQDHGERDNLSYMMPFMLAAAAAAACIIIIITVFLVRGHDKTKYKLGDLQSSFSNPAEKDYQDLCRARMTTKGGGGNTPAERVIMTGTQNERPPSSRSSTSSWSEEPALTNMDISTGHMVLSYMEDHLRNKGRLQREWEVLCRYEAEPSARDAALQSQCAQLNRPDAPLPYDHSRVVLNHLVNAEGLDYINASTITDHDPRAPAYVAAQGPLPATISHFWQMIWEQGAVVIVTLCRLQENNESACARYWPEEGSEVYHMYEVHLVSEHIWCDDYLVRSFYLKNLRTGETRTVTQFHFLSWPQNGIPTSAKALLDFRRKVNKSYRGRSCPIVVHSSAGAGRTGAYILLDLVLGRMSKGAREIDIAATLEHLRDQRAGLVATRQQFEFVLMAVAEEVHAILKALPQNTQSEKRELDIETVKEQEDENAQKPSKDATDAKEQSKK